MKPSLLAWLPLPHRRKRVLSQKYGSIRFFEEGTSPNPVAATHMAGDGQPAVEPGMEGDGKDNIKTPILSTTNTSVSSSVGLDRLLKKSLWKRSVTGLRRKRSVKRSSTGLLVTSSASDVPMTPKSHSFYSFNASGHSAGSKRKHRKWPGPKSYASRIVTKEYRSPSTPTTVSPEVALLQDELNFIRVNKFTGLYSASTADLLYPSLSKSFESAVNKLDFEAMDSVPKNTGHGPRLSSARSFFSLRRSRKGRGNLTELLPHARRSRTGSVMQSAAKVQRRDPDPLRMHNETMAFSVHPSATSDPVTPETNAHDNQHIRDADVDDSDGIDQAFIFSPSTGDLSQYTRPTPNSSDRCSDHLVRMRQLQETPTRKPFYKSGSALKQSFSMLFERSTSLMKLNSKTPTKTPKRRSTLSAGASPHSLSRRIVTVSARRSKNSSSLSVTSSREELVPQSPTFVQKFLPATPSPLQYEAGSRDVVGRRRQVATSTPVITRNNSSSVAERRGTVEGGPLARYWQRWDSAPALLNFDTHSNGIHV